MLNVHQSLHSKMGLITIKILKAPIHNVSESCQVPCSINKLTLNEPAMEVVTLSSRFCENWSVIKPQVPRFCYFYSLLILFIFIDNIEQLCDKPDKRLTTGSDITGAKLQPKSRTLSMKMCDWVFSDAMNSFQLLWSNCVKLYLKRRYRN